MPSSSARPSVTVRLRVVSARVRAETKLWRLRENGGRCSWYADRDMDVLTTQTIPLQELIEHQALQIELLRAQTAAFHALAAEIQAGTTARANPVEIVKRSETPA
jgi:hypothetical protein